MFRIGYALLRSILYGHNFYSAGPTLVHVRDISGALLMKMGCIVGTCMCVLLLLPCSIESVNLELKMSD